MKNLLLTGLMLISVNGFANEKGNGGDAYIIDGKYYSLDLVEVGLEKEKLEIVEAPDPLILDLVKKKIPASQSFPAVLFAKKMSELKGRYENYYTALKMVFEHYNWRFVNSRLTDINDENTSLDYDSKFMRQAAVRYMEDIKIDKNVFNKMNDYNQLALIFHELHYAMQNNFDVKLSVPQFGTLWPWYCFSLNSEHARKMTQYILDPLNFGDNDALIKEVELRTSLPMLVQGPVPNFEIYQLKKRVLVNVVESECSPFLMSAIALRNYEIVSTYERGNQENEACIKKSMQITPNYSLGWDTDYGSGIGI